MTRVAFKTIGCRLNQAETATMAAALGDAGYRVVPFGDPADVVVIHTCTITANAEQTCARLARSLKRQAPAPFVVLAGCAVEVNRDALRERTGADLLVNQEEKRHLADLLAPHRPALADPRAAASAPAFTTTRALVKVQDGCDFFCSYCIVPYARGRSTSLPLGDIVDNVRRLTAHGYREVVLTGANLGCYQDQAHGLPELVEALQALPDLWRIRISSIEISTSETVVLEAMAGSDKLCRFLHLPVQSGDDDVLRRMRRRYDAAALRRLVASAVDRLPTLGLGADIIVGFPGESEAAFANTRRLIEDLPFSNLHVFPYSPRPGTPAADMPDQVPVPIRKTRAAELIALGRRKREAFAASFVGQSVEVLVERTDADGRHRGWTSEYVEVRFHDADAGVNDLVRLTPTSTDGTMLLA